MGMVQLMLIAAAAKKASDRRASAARRRKSAERRKEAERKSTSYHVNSEHTYLQCVLKEIAYKDEDLKKFFSNLWKELKIVPLEDVNQIREKADKYYNMLEKLNAKLIEEENKLREKGIDLSGKTKICADGYGLNYHFNGWDDSYGVDYYQNKLKGKEYTVFSLFNGCEIRKDMLDNPNDTKFREDYEYKKRYNEIFIEEEKKLKEELVKKERRLKFSIIDREGKKEDIKKIKERLDYIQKEKDEEERRRVIMENYENLTDEQKQAIRSYLDVKETMDQTISLIHKYGNECHEIERNRYSKKYLLKALENVVETNGITEEDLEKIFKKMDRVSIRNARNEYDFKFWDSSVDGQVESYKPAIQGFIEYVYEENPKFIENNVHEIHIVDEDLGEETKEDDCKTDNNDSHDEH